MTLKTIRLELGRNPGFPEGSNAHGYEFKAPLKDDGHIDPQGFASQKAACTVHRFWRGEKDKSGVLQHTRNHVWAFSYEPGQDDDEDFFKLDGHVFKAGEYVTIREPDGKAYAFKVVSVR